MGCYVEDHRSYLSDFLTGSISFSPAALDDAQDLLGGSNIGHELFHAVQAVEMPQVKPDIQIKT